MIGVRSRVLACLVAVSVALLGTACGKAVSGSAKKDSSAYATSTKLPALANERAQIGAPSGDTSSQGSSSGTGTSDLAAETAVSVVRAACLQTSWKAHMEGTETTSGKVGSVSADMQADLRPGHVVLHVASSSGLEEEAVGGTDYVRQGGAKWFKVDPSSIAAGLRRPPCGEFMDLAYPALSAVQELPDETAGSAHHYRFQADAYTLLSTTLITAPTIIAALKAQPVQVSADLYIDDAGHPLRYEITTPQVPNNSGGTASVQLTETYSDFGTPVTVVAPGPSQLTDQPPSGFSQELSAGSAAV